MPIYSTKQNHIHVYRAKSSRTGKPVVLKLCTVNHLDTLARLRLEWKMLSDPPPAPPSKPSSTSGPSQSPASVHPGASGGAGSGSLSSAALANMPSVIRPCAWEYLPDGGLTLVYLDEPPLMTLEEAFLVSASSPPVPATPGDPQLLPAAKPRTQSDLIRILTVFSEVVNVLDCAHQSGITHNNSMFIFLISSLFILVLPPTTFFFVWS